MQWLKQSTAITAKIGPFIDDTDGKTAETGLTIAQADVRLSKNGGDIAQKTEATSCTHDELGIYGCPLDTTDTATLGRLQLWVHESGALPVWHEFMIVPANVWDSMFGSDMLKVDVHAIDDDETAANNLESYCDGTTPIPANATQISDDATAANNLELITEIANITSLTVDLDGHLEANVVEIEGADPTDTIRDAVVDDATRIDASELNTLSGHDPGGTLCADGTPLTAAETESEVNDALVALKLDHLVAVAENDDPVDNSIVAKLAASDGDWSGFSAAAESLEALRDRGDAAWVTAPNDPSAATIADAVWDEAASGHVDAGKAGQQLWTDLDAVLADTNELQTDDIPGAISGLNDPTAAAIADAVWDEDIVAAHNTADTAGLLLDTNLATILADTNELQADDVPGLIAALNDPTAAAIRTEMDSNSTQLAAIVADTNELQTDDVPGLIGALNDPTAASVADAVWDELGTGHTDAGKAGLQLWTDLDAVLADTNELQTDWADGGRLDLLLDGASAPSAATVADAVWDEASAGHTDAGKAGQQLWTDLDAVLADTAELQTDDVPSLISALNDIAVTDITQRQIPDSIPADGTLPTIEQAIYMITQFLHERAVSGTTVTVKKVDGSTSLLTLTLDDDTDPTSITRAS